MPGKLQTKDRVLEAASEVFAQKGYRDATVQDICAAAKANVAAVNYYFGSKEKLYLAVWEYLSHIVHQQYFENIRSICDPVERLRQLVLQRVRNAFDEGPAGRLRRVLHSEMGDPTEAHAEIRNQFLRPLRKLTADTVAEILGRDPSDAIVRRCAFSVQSQLVSLARLRMKTDSDAIQRLLGGEKPGTEQIDELAEHLIAFMMAGIRAVSQARRG